MNKDDEYIWSNENYAYNAVIDIAQDKMQDDAQKLYNRQNVQIIVLLMRLFCSTLIRKDAM